MNSRVAALLIFAGLGGWWFGSQQPAAEPVPVVAPAPSCPCGPKPCPCPSPLPTPLPVPSPAPCPGPGPCPPRSASTEAKPVEGGKISPDGTEELICDLPESEKKRNVGGRDGAGLCVFTSIEYVARWQNERRLFNLQQQMRAELGGGYPSKVTAMLSKYAPGVQYVQNTTGDREFLRAVLRSGRMAAITYCGWDAHYNGQKVPHMVALPHLTDRWACVTDNNFPRDNQHVWMSPDELFKRWEGYEKGWTIALIAPPPPPMPRN